ncbi:sortase B protein-sorting domain-containing protein [Coleofasciculus sp.]
MILVIISAAYLIRRRRMPMCQQPRNYPADGVV